MRVVLYCYEIFYEPHTFIGAGTSPPADGGVRPELGWVITGSGAEPQKKILPLKRFLGLKTRTQRT